MPDWSGRLWWVTDTGVVGYTDPASGMSWAIKLPSPQQIGNSFAVDETGGVFIASNYAMYRFEVDATGQKPTITWCYSYDRGTRKSPASRTSVPALPQPLSARAIAASPTMPSLRCM